MCMHIHVHVHVHVHVHACAYDMCSGGNGMRPGPYALGDWQPSYYLTTSLRWYYTPLPTS